MGLSVIVTAYRSTETLQRCVERLQEDPAVTQILVADCSETAPALPVPIRSFPAPTAVPVMRWAMLAEVSEPVVACLEGRCVPEPGWGTAILAAHAAYPETPGIGGAVDVDSGAGWLDRVVWFCEYAAFAPPLADAPSPDISGAHLSYQTAALRNEEDLLRTGSWETIFHLRWRAVGRYVRTNPVRVEFRNGMNAGDFLRQRFHYGRGYGAARGKPWVMGFLTPALPFLLTLRTFTAARRAGRTALFLSCLPGIFFFHAMWSCGELLGYWFGNSVEQHIY
jgi:hypothetical protein